jgi:hypothetical protein
MKWKRGRGCSFEAYGYIKQAHERCSCLTPRMERVESYVRCSRCDNKVMMTGSDQPKTGHGAGARQKAGICVGARGLH